MGQRDDGFHELQTLFQLLDFGDNLSFEITLDGRVERSDNPGLPEDDLTILAARALKSYSHCELGVKISLDKRIPLGAGLGGGSSINKLIKEIGQEIEGINTARVLYEKSRELGIQMPISEQVYRVIFNDLDPASAVTTLLGRAPREETD